MSRIIRDWRCPDCGHVHEEITRREEVFTDCPKCGKGSCSAIPSAPKLATMKMGADPDFPTAADKWAKAHKGTGPDQG